MSEGHRQLDQALAERRSVRGYRPEPIDRDLLVQLFATAQRAPSWCNIQPWRVVVTAPPVTDRVRQALLGAARGGLPSPELPFPMDYPPPYLDRRRACGFALYGAMGIARDDKAARYDAWLRNYEIFDAPHVAIVSRHRKLGEYATLDVGVWLGVLVSTAALLGIDLCPMAALAGYPQVLRQQLAIADDQVILFGIALGREDPAVPANACRTDRDPVEANIRFAGWDS